LDLSAEAQELLSSQSVASSADAEIRMDRVAALRQAIADGSYETPERLSAALDRMLDTFS
jgi:anti-sigma28 factor (negative regulator of flagellin synthesis)